jgi:type II secretory pathway pseudopilin PulG
MVEIAISLAIIGFALVAIVGILPIGMGMQKQNRQESVVNADASVFLNAIRNGEQGLDYLTNYIIGITNDAYYYNQNGTVKSGPVRVVYWPGGPTWLGGSTTSPQYPLNSGYRIIGLLSTPKYVPLQGANGGYISNHVVSAWRALSGPASDSPQKDTSLRELAFGYRLIPEIVTYGTYYNPALYPLQPVGNPQPLLLQSNLSELRLTFRWPLMDTRGNVGPSQQSFRCTVGGYLQPTNEPGYASYPNPGSPFTLYFFQPRTYVNTNSF